MMGSESIPKVLWGLDPVFWTSPKLSLKTVLKLKPFDDRGVWNFCGHPITNINVMGHIVSRQMRKGFIDYVIDDGTELLSCIFWLPKLQGYEEMTPEYDLDAPMAQMKLGWLVDVFGRISSYNNQMQITISSIEHEHNSNVEVMRWLEIIKLSEFYSSPDFIVPDVTDENQKYDGE